MCIRVRTFFIVSIGQGEPAITPVRSEERSNSAKRGCSSSAMNIVGTPYSDVHRSAATVSSTASGSKASPGTTTQAPRDMQARLPMTMPKQW